MPEFSNSSILKKNAFLVYLRLFTIARSRISSCCQVNLKAPPVSNRLQQIMCKPNMIGFDDVARVNPHQSVDQEGFVAGCSKVDHARDR